MAEPSEIDMGDGKRRQVEVADDFGNVKSTAVVCGDERECQEIVRKIVKVFIFNEQTDAMLVENGNDRDIRVEFEAGSLDVEKGALGPIFVQEPPSVHWREAFDEELDIVIGIRFSAFESCLVERLPEGVPGIQSRRREGADVFP